MRPVVVRLPFDRHLARLSPATQAALWMLVGGFCSVMMNVLIRIAAERMHPFEVTFFRCLFSLGFMLPFILKAGSALLHNSKILFFTLRAAVGLASMLTWFYGITLVPLATATAVNFTAPLFATIGAALILHEDVRARRWSAVVIGFVGVMVILRPSRSAFDVNLLLILFSAASAAMNNITVKFLVRSERPNVIVAMFVVYLTPLSLIPALFVWTWPDLHTLIALIGLGAIGTVAHISVARAYQAADASACAPYEFVRLPYAALVGYLFFGEITDIWTWVGAAIIISASMYVAYRETHVARHGRAEAAQPAR
ncbi:MAG TPA: DMT family transporter [Stellaceae bacterium]|nr:DMT family transporter [Stellaceae bacterium]